MKNAEQMEHKLTYTRTRLAPTPSGFLHLGNVFSFALTAGLARESGARILLRIDDMDRERMKPEYVQDIFDTLHFLGIPWDEGPGNYEEFEARYSQLHRLPLYMEALNQLRAGQKIFACTCSRREILRHQTEGFYPGTCRHLGLSPDLPQACWRLLTAEDAITVIDHSGQERTNRLPEEVKDFIVRKKDGFPAYQLCSLMDDLYWEVDLVVRGADLWPSTLAQHFLATALGKDTFGKIHFLHHALLVGEGGRKFSKSAGDTSVRYLKERGHTPAEVYNLLGGLLHLPEVVSDWQSLTRAWLLAERGAWERLV